MKILAALGLGDRGGGETSGGGSERTLRRAPDCALESLPKSTPEPTIFPLETWRTPLKEQTKVLHESDLTIIFGHGQPIFVHPKSKLKRKNKSG